jgi:TATA-box binding protein (TBP) (component of TFIID and TFIIIB)
VNAVELSDYVGKPCKSRVAFEFRPKKEIKIDLEKAAKSLREEFSVELESKLLIIVAIDAHRISIFPSGKILVRGEREEAKARKLAEKILKNLPQNGRAKSFIK